jgi:hypothetical protein
MLTMRGQLQSEKERLEELLYACLRAYLGYFNPYSGIVFMGLLVGTFSFVFSFILNSLLIWGYNHGDAKVLFQVDSIIDKLCESKS